jgi:hypothetical protein
MTRHSVLQPAAAVQAGCGAAMMPLEGDETGAGRLGCACQYASWASVGPNGRMGWLDAVK